MLLSLVSHHLGDIALYDHNEEGWNFFKSESRVPIAKLLGDLLSTCFSNPLFDSQTHTLSPFLDYSEQASSYGL